MKLFLREHLVLIVVHVVQLFLVLLIYVLDGYPNWMTGLYAVFLGFFVLFGYLIYRYTTHRAFYKRLESPMASLDESIRPAAEPPLPAALGELLAGQYRQYQEQLHTWEHRRKSHLAFITQWVHQMKTPISVIHLTVQHKDDPDSISIREEAERLDKGMETVLYAARLEAFEQDFQVDRLQLRDIVSKAIHENKRSFIRNEVFPDLQVEPELWVESDAKWLRFVLHQLISNAVKYSSGSRQKVAFIAHADGDTVALEIRDRGVGMPPQDLKRVFRPFFTGENGRQFRESTGMGLYLVKEICDQLQHRVEVDSEAGEGTVVRLYFRRVEPYSFVS